MAESRLLWKQEVHRSQPHWIQSFDQTNQIKSYLHVVPNPNPLIIPFLKKAGFDQAAKVKHCPIDHALVTALVERWRPETHTFHLPCGECTITLQDVALQLGLRVKGRPVTNPSFLNWDNMCQRFLGVVPEDNQKAGQFIKMKWLRETFSDLAPDASIEQRERHCRAYILRLIGGVLMPDKSGNRVHLMWLSLLEDFETAGHYSWGSACLGTLYREMCCATAPAARCMGGCTTLLQSWAWYRMPFIAPRTTRELTFPLAERWSGGGMHYTGTPRGDTVGYRSRFDHMRIDEFVWMPYIGLQNNLPRRAFRDEEYGNGCTVLICFAIIEWHQTDRVKLQFGLRQEIPGPPINLDQVHDIDMRGNHTIDWVSYHTDWLSIWRERRGQQLEGQPLEDNIIPPTNEYMIWFYQNSLPYLSVQQQLRDPRRERDPDVRQPSPVPPQELPTQRRARHGTPRQATPPLPPTVQTEELQPHRHSFQLTSPASFDYTPSQPEEAHENCNVRRHSFAYSEDDFILNLFGANCSTPQSAEQAFNQMYGNAPFPPFGQSYSPFQMPSFHDHGASSSAGPFVRENEHVQSVNDAVQHDEHHVIAEQQHEPPPLRRNPARNTRPRPCGTGHHLHHRRD